MITDEQIKIFDEKIRAAGSVVLCAHKNPDGDALCSVLALAHLIETNYNKDVVCTYDGNIPDNLDNVPLRKRARYFERIEYETPFDVAIVLDYGIEKNIGGPGKFVKDAKFIIEMDHHINDDKIGNLCIDDVDAVSTTEIIYNFGYGKVINKRDYKELLLYADTVTRKKIDLSHFSKKRMIDDYVDLYNRMLEKV